MQEKEKTLQIETGVFWVCFNRTRADFLFDKGKFTKCGKKSTAEKITKDEDGLNYKLSHKKAWEDISKNNADGIYAEFTFSDFPRGRIWFDFEERRHYVMFDKNLSAVSKIIEEQVKKYFDLIDPEFIADSFYKSKIPPEVSVIRCVFEET